MLFCTGNVVDDDITVNRIFLVNPVCGLQSANVIHRFNAAYAHLFEKLRLITFAETCQFLLIQSLEFQEIWQK